MLVHGGVHRGSSWSPLLPHLNRPAFALDLPGRGASVQRLRALTWEDFVESAVADVRATGLRQVTLVGHSLAGVILPEVAARLPEVVHHVVFISCSIMGPGQTVLDFTPLPLRILVGWRLRRGVMTVPRVVGRVMFCNGMTPEQRRFVLDQLCSEAPSLLTTSPPARAWPAGVGRSFVVLERDHALPVRWQQRFVENLGACEVVRFDGNHDCFVTHPAELAGIVNRHAP